MTQGARSRYQADLAKEVGLDRRQTQETSIQRHPPTPDLGPVLEKDERTAKTGYWKRIKEMAKQLARNKEASLESIAYAPPGGGGESV